ncbi:MAG: ROK family protein [Alphaproteobacteria bacterium]|nr:ROK family protein [Alphaproteobacteria bacterium]
MPDKIESGPIALAHGAQNLPKITVDTYNEELRESEGFVGDRASKRAFAQILEEWRERMRRLGKDPLGDKPTEEISKKKLDKILAEGDPESAGLIQGAIEDFAKELATVMRRFLKLKSWRDTQRVVIGGGLRNSRLGELAIGRAAVLLKTDGIDIELVPIRHHPDEAGLIGSVHLVPSWILSGHDGFLAVDIGGTNIRAGIVATALERRADLSKAEVLHSELWRHADDKPSREEAVERLIEMLAGLVKHAAKEKLALAPMIGVGCPGMIREDGSIERGGQNLPGNWESSRFSLPDRLKKGIPKIMDHPVVVLMHNDAVVQGLSELPFMQDVEHWGVFTIGTGLGNARFTNKPEKKE